ncbi:MAG: bifunctional riboflavin kinase/FAD synthetase [Deltaproteobacteria bacterium]|nr:bifunctional riboflavin kinase/FAD synthetase [Deltaproteobacteria bacterium]
MIRSLAEVPPAICGGVATIGNFDGVHRGHHALLERVRKIATQQNLPALAITFEPHPKSVLNPQRHPFYLLTTLEEKISLLQEAGITALLVIPFDESFAAMTATGFVEEVLVRQLALRHLVIGHDYAFGRNKSGNEELLRRFANQQAFELQVLGAHKIAAGIVVSSSTIRQAVMDGDLPQATTMLGRFYSVSGEVIRGEGRGRQIGFPTANISSNKLLLPPRGVYATFVTVNGARFKGALNIGLNPTFGGTSTSVEVFILDFNDDIYGSKVQVEFIKRIRNEKAFSSVADLVKQIALDVSAVKNMVMPYSHGENLAE